MTKMLFPNFCLNSIHYFIAGKEILSTRSMNFVIFFILTDHLLIDVSMRNKRNCDFLFFLYFPDRPTAKNGLVKVSINTESKNHGLSNIELCNMYISFEWINTLFSTHNTEPLNILSVYKLPYYVSFLLSLEVLLSMLQFLLIHNIIQIPELSG